MILSISIFSFFSYLSADHRDLHSFPTRRSSDLLALIVALWIKDNLPREVDIDWVKQGGGFIRSKHAPSGRFNAGEKDRKSTRLNSSHRCISYAVFCLKKKKNEINKKR